MVGHYNMRGFNQLLLEETGFINRVSFQGGQAVHGPEYSVMAAAKSCDAALVIGSDPLSSLPFGTARALARLPLIAIDPRRSLTTDAAKVVIPSAMYGLEAAGTRCAWMACEDRVPAHHQDGASLPTSRF